MRAEPAKNVRPIEPVRIGLAGCGRLAEFGYLPAFRQAAGVRLAAVADVNLTRCKEIAPGVPAHESTRALVDAGGVDAVVISTPTRFHLPDARCAAEAGLPALLEKPPGLDVGEARAIYALYPSPWIGFNRRFDPAIRRFRDELPHDGEIRLELELHYRRASWKPFDMHDDALLDLGPHLIDLTRWLSGSEIRRARSLSLSERGAEFELTLARGQARISCSSNSPYRERIEVKDSRGCVLRSYRRGGLIAGIAARLASNRENPLVRPMAGQLEAFGRAVRGTSLETTLATAADGLAVMCVIDALRRSAAGGGVECSLPAFQRAD
jgi:predicted dehydrogenase